MPDWIKAREEYLRRNGPTLCPERFAVPSPQSRNVRQFLRDEIKASRS